MKIYTSYFAKLSKIPKDIIPISICSKAPSFYMGIQYKKLAPKYSFFSQWKITHDNNYYIEHFTKEILDKLNCKEVYEELKSLSENKDIVLICYEKPSDFCHRHLVAEWFNKNKIKCEEYN